MSVSCSTLSTGTYLGLGPHLPVKQQTGQQVEVLDNSRGLPVQVEAAVHPLGQDATAAAAIQESLKGEESSVKIHEKMVTLMLPPKSTATLENK